MASRAPLTDENYASRVDILQDLFTGRSTPQTATEALAALSLSDRSRERGLGRSWATILLYARESTEHHDLLVDLLVRLSELPNAKDDKRRQIELYGGTVWRDMPTLGWDMNYEWNGLSVPSTPGSDRANIIASYINVNKFVAKLMLTDKPILCYSLFALWTMRAALETTITEMSPHEQQKIEAEVPAAAAWIDILGPAIYRWDEEFEHGPLVGAAGKGGPLWQGKYGFCPERWTLWRERFAELASDDALPEAARDQAQQAAERMSQIERDAE